VARIYVAVQRRPGYFVGYDSAAVDGGECAGRGDGVDRAAFADVDGEVPLNAGALSGGPHGGDVSAGAGGSFR
jgi:hypothetical protein